MNDIPRPLRRLLMAFPPPPREPRAVWRNRRRQLVSAAMLVRVFYACVFFILVGLYGSWDEWMSHRSFELLWPVGWFEWTGLDIGVPLVVFGAPVATLAALLWPHARLARAVAAVAILMFVAFFNSFGITMHGLHAWVWVAALLVLLPDGPIDEVAATTSRAQRYLRVYWSAQAALLMFYSLSGLFKLAAAAQQAWHGQVHSLAPEALARHAAYRLLEGAEVEVFTAGPFLVEHPWVGYPFFLTAIFLETFAFLVAFRPALHRWWGLGLILMQVGIYFTMTIMFTWHVMALALMIVCSPFAPPRTSLRDVVRYFPLVGDLLAWRERRVQAAAALWQAKSAAARALAERLQAPSSPRLTEPGRTVAIDVRRPDDVARPGDARRRDPSAHPDSPHPDPPRRSRSRSG